MKYELKEGVTKESLHECKFNVSEWTISMRENFQKNMFKLGIFRGNGETSVQFITEPCYYTDESHLTYTDEEDNKDYYFEKSSFTEYTWQDIFEPVTTGVKLDEHNFNKHFLSESLSPEELVGLKVKEDTSLKPHKSSGGSSKYYEVVLPQWLLDKQSEKGFIMLEDLAEVMFENDFNYTNIFKAQKRMFDLQNGGGKVGNTLDYDATKCKYYIDKQVEVFNRDK